MKSTLDLKGIIAEVGELFAQRSRVADQTDAFVAENLESLKHMGVYKALIPQELGGAGLSVQEMCEFLRDLAKHCGSTALTLSMHQHLVAVNVWKYLNGKPVGEMLKNVAAHDLILVSTGGGDWLASNGEAEKVPGGYRINCMKFFASGSLIGDIAVMSCAHRDENGDEHVLHFGQSMKDEGVQVVENWKAMGMRGTGSNAIKFENVFVPDEKIALKRPRGEWHPVWDVVTTIAFPIFMAPYVGLAEGIAEKVLDNMAPHRVSPAIAATLGAMNNQLRIAQLAIDDMILRIADLKVQPDLNSAHLALTGKSLISEAIRQSAQYAMEAMGGRAYFRDLDIERMYRDLLAGEFHPLQASKQREAAGRILLGGTPADIA